MKSEIMGGSGGGTATSKSALSFNVDVCAAVYCFDIHMYQNSGKTIGSKNNLPKSLIHTCTSAQVIVSLTKSWLKSQKYFKIQDID